jgi:hypothetical protein
MTLSNPDIGIIMLRMSLIRFVILMLQIWLFMLFGLDVVGISVEESGGNVAGCLVCGEMVLIKEGFDTIVSMGAGVDTPS